MADLQAVEDNTGAVRTRVAWRNFKSHLTKDKIIVFILIVLLWGFSSVPLFLFYSTSKSHELREDANVTKRDPALPDCNFTSGENVTGESCIYDNFYFEESTNSCVPNCYTWTSYAPATSTAIDGLVLFCSCIATLTSLGAIILSFTSNKSVFRFPSSLVFYMSLSSMLRYSILLIGYFDKHNFFCLSQDLMKNYISPPPYCVLAGAINDYYTIQLCIWIFCHIFSIYFLIFYPLQAKQLLSSSKLKYVHLCVVLVGLLAPLLGPLTTILHNLSDQKDPERLGYRVLIYPPHTCINFRAEISFYTTTIPINYLLTLSISFLILAFWKLLKGKQSADVSIGTAEKKILATLCFYILLNFTWPTNAVLLAHRLTSFRQKIDAFFMCASKNGISDLPQLDEVFHPVVAALTWLLLALFPFFLLAYVVDYQRLKKCVMKKRGV